MKIFEVTLPQQMLIKRLFGGFVFRRTVDSKHYVKVSRGQEKTISKYLFMNLENPVTL